MKTITTALISVLFLLCATRAAADVTLTSSPVPSANITQGSSNFILYIVKMDVTGSNLTSNHIQFNLTGTHDNDDLSTINVYFNATAPSLSGASLIVANAAATFAAPHFYDLFYNLPGSQTVNAGSAGYFIITASASGTATNGHTIKINGAINPVTFTYTSAPAITNNQTDAAGSQTIIAGNVALSTISSPAASVTQGSTNKIVYIVKADATVAPVTMSRIQFTLSGTYDNDDLTTINVYYNAGGPVLAGSSLTVVNAPATFAAPHLYDLFFNIPGSQTIAAGSSGYFIIVASVSNTATNGNTFKINGAANPVTFTYSLDPVATNSQSDLAGTQTILAGAIAFSTISSPAANITQTSTNNILYIVKADVTGVAVTLDHIRFTLDGTFDNDDLTNVNVYFNATAPTLSGAGTLAINSTVNFGAPQFLDQFFNIAGTQTIAAGSSGYFIITVSVSNTATNGHFIKINGGTNPATFTYTTAPFVSSTQSDLGGAQTIVAPAVNITSSPVPATNIAQGSNNILYIAKADVTNASVVFNRIQFTLLGTHDNDDLTVINVYFNPTAPSLSGSNPLILNLPATFAAPHLYDLPFNIAGTQGIAAGSSGYFIITATVSATGTAGNTVKVNGAANPVTFNYNTGPTVTSNQTDVAGTQTIQAVGITISTPALAPATIYRGSNNNIFYVAKTDVTSLPVTISRIQFTITGTMDNNDLTLLNIYYNASAPVVSGATLLTGNNAATFAAPHTYDLPFNFSGNITINAGASGFFIITANVDATATLGNTAKINGAANPVTFTYSTGPTITNNQTDGAGVRTFGSLVPLTLVDFSGKRITPKAVELNWTTASEINTKSFEVEWSTDGQRFSRIATMPAANNSTQLRQYSFLHNNGVIACNNYYRLKTVDNDGNFTYSGIIKIVMDIPAAEIFAFPNPFIKNLQLQVYSGEDKKVQFVLTDANGKRIALKTFSLIKGDNRVNWDLPDLPAGNYMISSSNREFGTLQVTGL